jgi:hypothetical protein
LVREVHIDRYIDWDLVLHSLILGNAIGRPLPALLFPGDMDAGELSRLPISSPDEEQEVCFA